VEAHRGRPGARLRRPRWRRGVRRLLQRAAATDRAPVSILEPILL
jgi:hypothetical protein